MSKRQVIALVIIAASAAFLLFNSLSTQAENRTDKATGLTLLYKDKTPFAEYAANHPLLAGRWHYKGETDKYWIGGLHYPTDNTDPSQTSYVLLNTRVAKSKAVDLGKSMKDSWATVVLLKPSIEYQGKQDDTNVFEAVAFSVEKQNHSFLFREKFPFAPKEITGVLKRHEAAHTKRSMLTGNYHIHTKYGAIEVDETARFTSEALDKLHNKKVVAIGTYKGNRQLVVNGNELGQRPAALPGTAFPLRPSFTPQKITVAR